MSAREDSIFVIAFNQALEDPRRSIRLDTPVIELPYNTRLWTVARVPEIKYLAGERYPSSPPDIQTETLFLKGYTIDLGFGDARHVGMAYSQLTDKLLISNWIDRA